MDDESKVFEGWCILELMGHRKLAGFVTEETVAGAAFIRLDVYGMAPEPGGMVAGGIEEPPGPETAAITQFYSPSAVYCMTPTTEAVARRLAQRTTPAPVSRYELAPPVPSTQYYDVDEGLPE